MINLPTRSLRLLAIGLSLVLTACQAEGVKTLESVAEAPAAVEETVGGGGTAITLQLPAGGAGEGSHDIRDGAAMALEDLGNGQLAMNVRHGASAGARLVLGAADGTAPAIAFSGNGEPHSATVFAMRSDAVDSTLEAVRARIAAGGKSVVMIVPQGFSAGDRARLTQGAGKALLGFVAYAGGGSGIGAALNENKAMLAKADAVAIFGDGSMPAEIAMALKTSGQLQGETILIGNLGWPRAIFSRPELEGALIAMPDQASLKVVSERYRKRTGRALSIDAAYGYDAVAVAAGIVRSKGAAGLTSAVLTTASGFRGSLGLFRFLPSGTVQRPLTLYHLKKGTLQVLDPEPDGF